jgi:hypothetical protein
MLHVYAIVIAAAATVGGIAGWNVRGWKAGADEARIVQALHAAVESQRAGADAAAARFEAERAKLAGRRQVITREVDRVVDRPIYRDGVCLDDDGVRLVTDAIAGTDGAGQPTPAVPAAPAAD